LSLPSSKYEVTISLTFPCSGNKQPTGNESLVEKWILHKLNIATTEINKQLGERNFMAASNAAYSFWLYELCDVYIVRPPSFRDFELAGW
jgi:valyl-tRNA synthetase